jgi:signal transduction histidine kinase
MLRRTTLRIWVFGSDNPEAALQVSGTDLEQLVRTAEFVYSGACENLCARTMSPLYTDFTLLAPDFLSFRRQESIFTVLNLVLIAALLLCHTCFASYFHSASPLIITILAVGLAIEAAELIWLQTRKVPLSATALTLVTWWSILLNAALATALSIITHGEDGEYFVLMVVPLLDAAFRLNLAALVVIITLADILSFLEVYNVGSVSKYFEAGNISLLYTIVGVLVWLLVNNLRDREVELERTRERLLDEEKLAAVGRLSSGIAHEIRNPVAMISSSLAMALRPGQNEAERNEMFGIAAKEAERLERLTTDFLAYARPRVLQATRTNVADLLNYVAAIARAHAVEKGVAINIDADTNLEGEFDNFQIQQALLNLVLNAVEACQHGDTVMLKAGTGGNGVISLDVVDPAGPILPDATARIFEPFFTTKPAGTGLGLAIARNIARAHQGDLVLKINQPGQVCFSMTIPARGANDSAETHNG